MLWCKMLFLGDSLTFGSRDPYGLSYPYYMTQLALEEKGYVILPEVYATPGWTSSQLVRGALPVIEKSEAKEAFILIGTNDMKSPDWQPGVTFWNIRVMAEWCKSFGMRVFVFKVPEPSGFGSPGYEGDIVARIKTLNSWIDKMQGYHKIDISQCKTTVDGIHLTEHGNREVAVRAWQAVLGVRTYGDEGKGVSD